LSKILIPDWWWWWCFPTPSYGWGRGRTKEVQPSGKDPTRIVRASALPDGHGHLIKVAASAFAQKRI